MATNIVNHKSSTSSAVPLYKEVGNHLKEKIVSRVLKPKEKLPTVKQLARQYKTSVVTITRAVRILRDDGLVTTKWGSGSYVNHSQHVRNQLKELATLVVSKEGGVDYDPSITSYYNQVFSKIALGVQEQCGKMNVKNHSIFLPQSVLKKKDALKNYIKQQSIKGDGLLVLWREMTRSEAENVQEVIDCPVVFEDMLRELSDFNAVQEDKYANACKIMKHFVDLGHKHIGCIAGPSLDNRHYKQRLAAYQDSIAAYELEFSKDYIVCADDLHASIYAGCQEFIARLCKSAVTAVFCFNDYRAQVLLNIAREKGIAVPDELSVAGFDGTQQAINRGITTIQLPFHLVGREMVLLLESIVEGEVQPPTQKSISTGIIVGKTTVGNDK